MIPPLARVLDANRARYNALFARARRERAVEPDAFAELLRSVVAPIAGAVDAVAPERLTPAVDALYELALELLGKGLLGPGSRSPAVVAAWKTLFPALARHVAGEPRRVLGALTNAAHNLEELPGARPELFLEETARLAPIAASAAELLAAGAVVAWRAGAAPLREAALRAAAELPPATASAALGVGRGATAGELGAALEALRGDPWLAPGEALSARAAPSLRIVAEAGGFRGFGGPFLAPPVVSSLGGRVVASDGEGRWLLFADRFGAAFRPVEPAVGPAEPGAFSIDATGRVRYREPDGPEETAVFPVLAGHRSAASTRRTLAVTLPLSHRVFLVARAPGAPA